MISAVLKSQKLLRALVVHCYIEKDAHIRPDINYRTDCHEFNGSHFCETSLQKVFFLEFRIPQQVNLMSSYSAYVNSQKDAYVASLSYILPFLDCIPRLHYKLYVNHIYSEINVHSQPCGHIYFELNMHALFSCLEILQ